MLIEVNIFTITLSFFLGICLIFGVEYLPSFDFKILLLILSALLAVCWQRRTLRLIVSCLLAMSLGLCYVQYQVAQFKQQYLSSMLEGQKICIVGSVKEVINKKSSQNLIIQTEQIIDNNIILPIKPILKIATYQHIKILPGQRLTTYIKAKLPRNYANPGSFDIEKFMFAARIHALGYIIGHIQLLPSKPTMLDDLARLRLKVATYLEHQNYQFADVMQALSIGINKLSPMHKEVFQNTGLAHLLAISGLHVGFIAMLVYQISKRFTDKYSLKVSLTIGVAILYSMLAGFSIPTQRALIMLSIFFSAKLLRRHVSPFNALALALLIVLLHDPLCILNVGFWLSFSAVLIILFLSSNHRKLNLIKFNFAITLAMIPLTLLFFNKTSIIAPLTNILFVPLISTLIVAACFVGVLAFFIHKGLADFLFAAINKFFIIIWPLLTKFSQAPMLEITIQSTQYVNLIILSLGIIYILYPRKLPYKPLAIVCVLPLLLYQPPAIEYGEVKFTQLDVGQGASSVIQTTNHSIIYDVGPRNFGFDAGMQVVVPFLKHEHIKQVDLLIVSHADNDHVGGVDSLMHNIFVKKVLAAETEKLEKYSVELCHRGQSWFFDGVKFEILHPDQFNLNKKRNDKSCVLQITSKSQKVILIAGDIEKKSEKQLVAKYADNLMTDVLVAPHHGSKTSSSREFLATVKPMVAIFPTGYKNRYGHPKLETLNKYHALNSQVFNTSYTGAVSFITNQHQLKLSCYRQEYKKFWHHD